MVGGRGGVTTTAATSAVAVEPPLSIEDTRAEVREVFEQVLREVKAAVRTTHALVHDLSLGSLAAV